MKKAILACGFCSLLLAVNAMAAAPVAQFDPAFPGWNIPFTHNVYPGLGDGHGYVPTKYGWVHDGWSGYASGGALCRIESTLGGESTKTSMQEDQDWIFSATYSHVGAMTSEFVTFAKHDDDGSRESRVFAIGADPASGTYSFLKGNATGSWDTVDSGLTFSEWQDITIHYKVGQGMDYYLGDTLVASNQMTGHGRYDVDFMQIEWTKAGTDKWRQIKLGQVPEPMSMLLLGVGGLALIRRRR